MGGLFRRIYAITIGEVLVTALALKNKLARNAITQLRHGNLRKRVCSLVVVDVILRSNSEDSWGILENSLFFLSLFRWKSISILKRVSLGSNAFVLFITLAVSEIFLVNVFS